MNSTKKLLMEVNNKLAPDEVCLLLPRFLADGWQA